MAITLRRLSESDVEEATRIRAVSFGAALDDESRERTRARCEAGELWGAVDNGPGAPLLAVCGLSAYDHWFGGRRVTCQHVASVAVPPEHRGKGVASALMREAAHMGVREGVGISLLYPATTRLYRKLGWEHAGNLTNYRIGAWQAMPVGERADAMRPATDDDWPAILACYELAASRASGIGMRSDKLWEQHRGATYRYVLDSAEPGTVDAYLLYSHETIPDDWRFSLEIHDWAATTAAGLRAVVGLVGSHGTLGRDATFFDGRPELWSLLVGEQDLKVTDTMFWMARGLDLAQAIDQRGFPPGFSGSVTIAIGDRVLPGAAGPWRLEIKDGRGSLAAASTASTAETPDVRLDARAIGPLFTGFRDPAQLALAGLAAGSADALAFLGAAFAGPPPVMLDFF